MNEVTAASWNPQLYDDKHAFVWKHGESLIELLAPRPKERILDLGCGTGHLTAQLSEAGASAVGIDSSTEMIAKARRSYPDLPFDIADATGLRFEAEFDAIFSNAVLHWIPQATAVALGVFRSLRPGGRFVAEFGGKGNVQSIVAAIQAALGRMQLEWVPSPWYFPSIAEYAGVLEQAGLEVTLAKLFDRWTPLDGSSGMRHWVEMFGGDFLRQVPAQRRDEFFTLMEEHLRPILFRDGQWHADYRRIRVVAERPSA